MNTKSVIAVSAAVALVVVLVVSYFQPSTQTIREVVKELGTAAGPDRFSPCESRDGVEQCFTRTSLTTASTTSCALLTPNATSSMVGFAVRFNIGSTTAKEVIIAKNSTNAGVVNGMQASTTVLGRGTLAANTQGTFMASTSPIAGDAMLNNILAPLSYVNVSLVGGSGTDSPTGICQMTVERI